MGPYKRGCPGCCLQGALISAPPPPPISRLSRGTLGGSGGLRGGGGPGGGGRPAALAIILPLPSYKDKPKSTLLASFILTLVRDSPPVDWPTVYAGRGRGQAAAQLVLV